MTDPTHGQDQGRPCPFCAIVASDAPATIVWEWASALAIVPLNPVTRHHVIVLPKQHVADATDDPMLTGYVMACASTLVTGGSANIITSIGRPATQSVFHLHIHVVPRSEGDGLALPWTGQTIGATR